jgi:hypothetical protein
LRFSGFFNTNSFVDSTWAAVELIIWTEVEPGVCLICACLPIYRPLLERMDIGRLIAAASSRVGGTSENGYGGGTSRQGYRPGGPAFVRQAAPPGYHMPAVLPSKGGSSRGSSNEEFASPKYGIKVTNPSGRTAGTGSGRKHGGAISNDEWLQVETCSPLVGTFFDIPQPCYYMIPCPLSLIL